jgi:hypothetical protein
MALQDGHTVQDHFVTRMEMPETTGSTRQERTAITRLADGLEN